MKIAVLVSGGGTNLGAIIKAKESGVIKSAEIALVISNKEGVYALERAKKAKIPYAVVTKKQYGREFEGKVSALLDGAGIDLIVLAGFTAILSSDFTKKYENKIINIHPSLIPSFCGIGFYGLHVHQKALGYGVKITGATVHFVSEEVDAGAIILQKPVKVHDDDTAQTLQKRVMEEAEWDILPKAIELIASNRLIVRGNTTKIKQP